MKNKYSIQNYSSFSIIRVSAKKSSKNLYFKFFNFNLFKKVNKALFKKINKNIIIAFLFIFSYFFYFLSLEKCLDGEDECGIRINWIIIKLIELLISCLIISFLFYL